MNSIRYRYSSQFNKKSNTGNVDTARVEDTDNRVHGVVVVRLLTVRAFSSKKLYNRTSSVSR